MSDEWVFLGLEEKVARRYGLPPRIPVPKDKYEGVADTGLPPEQVRAWVTAFVGQHSNGLRAKEPQLLARYEAFLGKAEHWKKAHEAFAKGDPSKAIPALRLVVAVDPNDHAARMNLASATAAAGDHAKALEHLKAIRETFEGDADYHVTTGNVLLARGDRDGAIGEMVLALEAQGDHQPALDVLKQLGVLSAIYEDPKDAASLTYVRTDSVLDWIRGIWAAAPRTAAYYLEQVAYHESERRPAVALEAARLGQQAEGDASTHERLAIAEIAALRSLGQRDEALAKARARVETDAKSVGGWVAIARLLADARDAAGAKDAIDRALAVDPGDLEALDVAFWPESRELESLSPAYDRLAAHVAAHQDSPGALRSLARMQLALGRGDEGIATLARAVSLVPNDDAIRSEWWVELTKAQRVAEVIADAEKLSDLPRRDWTLRWSEAEAYAALGKKMEARAAFAAINADESLTASVRKRAKRAAEQASA
ncbi:MAG: tetratricopeptide repeat protein [Polyangiales bacterium]